MNWVAFFSQTGSEIVNICEEINRWPDLIVTNRMDGFDKINPELTKRLLNAVVSSQEASFYVIPQENIFNIFESNIEIKVKMLETLADMYNSYNANLFNAYQNSLGFLNLGQVYNSNVDSIGDG